MDDETLCTMDMFLVQTRLLLDAVSTAICVVFGLKRGEIFR